MPAEPVLVPDQAGGGGEDEVLRLRDPGDRDVRLDPSPVVEPLRVDDTSGFDVDVVRTHALEETRDVAPDDPQLSEGGDVEEADVLPHCQVFLADGVEPRLPTERVLVALATSACTDC